MPQKVMLQKEKISIMFFCLGNICRSPIAEGLFRVKVEERNLSDFFHIESSGTSGYHKGEKPDSGSIRICVEKRDLDISYQRSQMLSAEDLQNFDHLVAMDSSNLSRGKKLGDGHFYRLRDYDPQGKGDVPDPYGEGSNMFGVVYDIIDRSTDVLLDYLQSQIS